MLDQFKTPLEGEGSRDTATAGEPLRLQNIERVLREALAIEVAARTSTRVEAAGFVAASELLPDSDKGEGKVRSGRAATVNVRDGRVEKVETIHGLKIERDGDKYVSNAGKIDAVTIDKDGNTIVDWTRTQRGNERSIIRPSGSLESHFSPPQSFKFNGMDKPLSGVSMVELSAGPDGRREFTLRTEKGEVVRVFQDKDKRPLGVEHIPAPANMKEKDLGQAAAELARIIRRSGFDFGSESDKRYLRDVFRASAALDFDFERKVNAALRQDGKRSRFELRYFGGTRTEPAEIFDIVDRSKGGKPLKTFDAEKLKERKGK